MNPSLSAPPAAMVFCRCDWTSCSADIANVRVNRAEDITAMETWMISQ